MNETPITEAAKDFSSPEKMYWASQKLETALNKCCNVLTEIAFGFRRPSKRGGGPGNIGMGAHEMQQLATDCLSQLSQFPEPSGPE